MSSTTTLKDLILLALVAQLALTLVAADSLSGANLAALDQLGLRIISEEDQSSMQMIKYHMQNDYSELKNIDEVMSFLERVRVLVQKHPKNTAFAQGELKELHKFLSQEGVTKLIRVDTDLFQPTPVNEDRLALAQRAIEEDELTRKLFGGPIRSLVEARRQQVTRAEDGNHKDGNFFTNFWCKISGGCSHQ